MMIAKIKEITNPISALKKSFLPNLNALTNHALRFFSFTMLS